MLAGLVVVIMELMYFCVYFSLLVLCVCVCVCVRCVSSLIPSIRNTLPPPLLLTHPCTSAATCPLVVYTWAAG